MSTSKVLAIAIVALTGLVAFFSWPSKEKLVDPEQQVVEIAPIAEIEAVPIAIIEESPPVRAVSVECTPLKSRSEDKDLPADVDRMAQLFQPYPPTLPFVETIAYTGRVDWVAGRSAYLGDYASHFQTSKHFISRSLHGAGTYLSDRVSKGDRFNVYRKDKQIEFHLVLDLSRLKLWLYCYDKGEDAKILLKTYPVCAGKLDPHSRSGSLTPLGTFAIGNDFAVYDKGVKGNFKNESCEMVTVYGMRWISLGRELAGCTGSSKGLGLHGVPWRRSPSGEELVESRNLIGNYESGGCISLLTEDIEELYAVIVSKPAILHIVEDFIDAKVPGKTLF